MAALETRSPPETIFGPVLVSLVIEVMLYGILATQAFLYLNNTARLDKLWVRALVATVLLAETANTSFSLAYTYGAIVAGYAQQAVYKRANWVFATGPASTAIIATCVQLFFARRIIHIHEPNLPRIVVVSLICLCAVAQLVGGIYTAAAIGAHPTFEDFDRFRVASTVWLSTATAADFLICFVFTRHVILNRREFAGIGGITDHISRSIVQNCGVLVMCAIVQLVLYLVHPHGKRLSITLPLSKLHTHALLCTLNARPGWGWGSAYDDVSSPNTQKSGGSAPGSPQRLRPRANSMRPGFGLGLASPTRMSRVTAPHRETYRLEDLGELGGSQIKLERVTTADGEDWVADEVEKSPVRTGLAA